MSPCSHISSAQSTQSTLSGLFLIGIGIFSQSYSRRTYPEPAVKKKPILRLRVISALTAYIFNSLPATYTHTPTAMKSHNQTVWKLEFDETFQQYYYLNTEDNSVSFDSPCEVSHRQPANNTFLNHLKKKTSSSLLDCYFSRSSSASSTPAVPAPSATKRRSVLSKIGSALSIRTSKSRESNNSLSATESMATLVNTKLHPENVPEAPAFASFEKTNSIISGLNDDYLLESPVNLVPYNSDMDSILSDESIHSYYSNINSNEIYYEEEENLPRSTDNYYYTYEDDLDEPSYDKEQERQELRLQFMRELEI